MDERKRDNLVVLIIFILTMAFLIAVIIYAELNSLGSYSKGANGTVIQSSLVYTDCLPDMVEVNENACVIRGCRWNRDPVDQGQPFCQFPNNTGGGYNLKLKKSPYQFILTKGDGPDLFGNQSDEIRVNFTIYNNYALRVLFFDSHIERFQIPKEQINVKMLSTTSLKGSGFIVEFCDNPWGFRLMRKDTKVVLFDTCGLRDLIISPNFLQLTARIESGNVYGMGERKSGQFKRNVNYEKSTLWSRDEGTPDKRGISYGQQPFYLNLEENGNAHGVLLLNSNAMETFLQPSPAITFRTAGGVLDFYFFLGPRPDDVIEQYVSAVGRPSLPPYWALGFHLGHKGAKAVDQANSLSASISKENIPLDVQWFFSKDYTNRGCELTNGWNDFPEFVTKIHDLHRKCVLSLTPAIAVVKNCSLTNGTEMESRSYGPYVDGLRYDIFVKNSDAQNFIGKSWQTDFGVHFSDFTHPNATLWAIDRLRAFLKTLNVDGLMLESNQPLNFNDENNYVNKNVDQCLKNRLNWPPFIPSFKDSVQGSLNARTLCMDTVQYSGRHYDMHGLYGHSMSVVVNKALKQINPKMRPFLVTESNFVGTGGYAFHIQNYDNFSSASMRSSIIGTMEYNMFGIPFTGATMCGEKLRPADPLCLRWASLGAFYPFSVAVVDAYAGVEFETNFASVLQRILSERYRLLPYLYTLLYNSHATGASVVRPLFFSFPKDNNTHDLDSQFLWGDGLMFSPLLDDNAVQRDVYYPDWRMYDYFERSEVSARGRSISVSCNETCIIMNTVGGTIIPMQIPSTTTFSSRNNPMELLASLNDTYEATGSLFLDDYETDNVDYDIYLLVKFTIAFENGRNRVDGNRSSLNFEILNKNFTSTLVVSTLHVLGCPHSPAKVFVNAKEWSDYTYSKEKKLMQITDLNLQIDKLDKDVSVSWLYENF